MLGVGQSRLRRTAVVAMAAAALISGCGGGGTSSTASGAQSTPGAGVATAPMPEPGVCKGCSPPLVYRGGPVLGTNGLTLTPIYWAPPGYTFPDGYVTLVNQYLADVAAASGRTDNTYAIDTEYSQTDNGTSANVKYSIQAGTAVTDSTAFPATDASCPIVAPNTACVTSAQVTTELSAQLAQGGLPADLAHMYLVLLPPNVTTTDGTSTAGFCAYHSSYELPNGGGTVIWANEPFTPGCFGGQSPNNNQPADTEIDTLSHEISEAMTDPLGSHPGWIDVSGNEIGDECNFNYGPPLGSADPNNPQTTAYNQVLNGHLYYAQTMFSNAAYQGQGVGHGCIQAAYSPGGAASAPPGGESAPPAGSETPTATTTAFRLNPSGDTPAQGTVDLSETRLAADGSSTSKATITVVDDNGEPVAGDHVHFLVQTTGETTASCGSVAPSDGVTDANGEMTTTYTASKADLACIVLGNDVDSGATDWGTVYQGSAADEQPGITDASLPTTLAPGGATQTFTVTASNPSKEDLKDVRFDVFLTGDDTRSTGVRADQVHISYSDANGGSIVPVRLTGETTDDGEIDGSAMPATRADLPAGASTTVTFQMSIQPGATTTPVTGQPLHLEVDVDQFDPADGTTDNLDYVGPADITVTG